jgi:GDP-L-fucose synthase
MAPIILVTGGSGLVGNALKEISDDYGYIFKFCNSSVCNLLILEETDAFFKMVQPDYVIHLAANVGGLYKNMTHGVEMFEDNIQINTNVLKCAKKYNVKKLIACLSTCIFPDHLSEHLDESMLHLGPPHESNAGYAYAKRMLEVQCGLYNKQFGCNFVCVVPTNVYGPGDNYNLENSHVIPGLIHKCYLAKQTGVSFIVSGTGKPLRQFIYSIDLAKLIMIVLSGTSETVILAPREEYSIRHIAEIIAKKFKINLEFDPSKSDGQYRKTADNSKLIKLKDFEFTPIEVGIEKTIDHFIKNYLSIRK